MNGEMSSQIDGRKNEWVDEWVDKWMDDERAIDER